MVPSIEADRKRAVSEGCAMRAVMARVWFSRVVMRPPFWLYTGISPEIKGEMVELADMRQEGLENRLSYDCTPTFPT